VSIKIIKVVIISVLFQSETEADNHLPAAGHLRPLIVHKELCEKLDLTR